LFFQFFNNVSYLLLAAIGLTIILGMMDIINLAHGEFMMVGAYIATISYHKGIPFLISILLSFLGTGLLGVLFERFILKYFYNKKLNAMVLTFGLSLILSQGALIIFGPSMDPISIPFGSFKLGEYSYSIYRIVLIIASFLILYILWFLFNRTKTGVYARATMQSEETAMALGVNTPNIYMLTFAIGSGLAGVSGALFAPIMAIIPTMGTQLMPSAFITVVVGGALDPIFGVIGSSILLSFFQTPIGRIFGAYLGRVVLLASALLIIRFFPDGVSGYIRKIHS
jgi:branched-chain amino acid transport system permease protein